MGVLAMKTKKLISTISYNTKDFLTTVCNRLVDKKIIEYWFAIYHESEADESKAHIHLCLCPTSAIDTVNLRDEFNQVDIDHPDMKPLGVMPFRCSKSFTDWYLYGIHHKGYLMSKNESRFWHYCFDDVFGSDLDLLHEMVNEIDMGRYRCYELIFEAVEKGVTFSSLLASGLIPLGWIYQFRELFNALHSERALERSHHANHEFVADTIEPVSIDYNPFDVQ
jgi:hypothetical protein